MSYCLNLNRNGDHSSSVDYLTQTAVVLKKRLQCWIASVLASGWMPLEPITETVDDNGLLFPLGLISCNLNGNFGFLMVHSYHYFRWNLGT